MPAPTKPPRCLELRINSVTDAKAIVQHQGAIFQDFKNTRSEAIEFIVAKEVDKETAPFIDRLFRVKTFKNVIEPKNGNVLGEIPHLLPPKPKLAIAVTQAQVDRWNSVPKPTKEMVEKAIREMDSLAPPKRRGRPPKVKV